MWLVPDAGAARCVLTFNGSSPRPGRLRDRALAGGVRPVPLVVAAVRDTGASRLALAGLDRGGAGVRGHPRGAPGLQLLDVGAELAALRRRKSPLEVGRLRSGKA